MAHCQRWLLSLVVVARDDDRLFALDVAPNGRSKYLRSKFSDGYGFHTARCVRAPGPYRPAPPLSIEARECVEIQKTGAKTWMERRAAEGKASPPLYPEVVAFRDMADRLRTQPDLDVRTIRKELDTLKPTLSRIRTFFQNLNDLQGRIDLANFQLKESRAEQNNAQGATAPKQDMEERIRAKETELEQLRSAIDEDHGEYRNFEALREGFDWVSSSVNEYLPQLVVAERALRVKGRNAPDAWRTRRAELIELEHYMGDLKSEITGNED